MRLKNFIFLLMICSIAYSQDFNDTIPNNAFANSRNKNKNSIYFEFLGSSPLYSINYDRIIYNRRYNYVSLACGYEYLLTKAEDNNAFSPQINYFTGANNKYFLIGLGAMVRLNQDITEQILTARIAYRYQQSIGGFFFQSGFSLLRFIGSSDQYLIFPGLAVGYTFK
jgi:hypothetical protein